MWTRKELKDKAKIAFKANYWKAVLVGLLLAVLLGGFSSFSSFSNAANSAATSSTVNTTPSSMHVHVNDPDDPLIKRLMKDLAANWPERRFTVEKLNAANRTEAVSIAMRKHLLDT